MSKFGQMHAAVTIMAAENHVPRFPEEGENNFWQIIAEVYIHFAVPEKGCA